MVPSSLMVNVTEVRRSAFLPDREKLSVNHSRHPWASSAAMVRGEGRSFRAMYSDEQEITP